MLLNRFVKLSRLLHREEDLWRQRPFVQLPVPWEAKRPELSAALRSLCREDILRFENCPTEVPAVRAAFPALIREIEELTDWAPLPGIPIDVALPLQPKRVSNRKWAQVRHFVQVLATRPDLPATRFVDWCAGKGHLGRLVHLTLHLPVTCVEKNASLCETGRKEAELENADIAFACADVLSPEIGSVLDSRTAALALHACGHLNVALIKQCVQKRVPLLAIAPCCYQRIDGMQYEPLFADAAVHNVPLTRHELRLPSLDETMTAAEARQNRRHKEHAFRLGVDLLHRQETGIDRYFPLGAVKPAWLKHDFAHFVRRVAAEKKIPLPTHADWAEAETAGWNLFYETTALGLARGIFRRALESLLLLDRALFLESHGYSVQIGTFCPAELTPRNLMIVASRKR